MGRTQHQSLRLVRQRQGFTVRLLETRSRGDDLRFSASELNRDGARLRLSTVGSDSPSLAEDQTGQDLSDGHYVLLAQHVVVPNNISNGHHEAIANASRHGATSPRQQPSRSGSKSLAVSRSVERRRQQAIAAGADSNVLSILFDSPSSRQLDKSYSSAQSAFINWMEYLDHDPFRPETMDVLNFLAYGVIELRWKTATLKTYKSALFKMFDQGIVARISSDNQFQEFMRLATQRGVKRLRSNHIDLNPVIRYLRALGTNQSMSTANLTKKLCWLLATCGFLRPDDLRCTDAKASRIVNGNLELEVLFLKETRQGQKIIKPVVICPHPDEALCPVKVFLKYRLRTQAGDRAIAHPKDPARDYTLLVRYVRDKTAATGTDRISNHIQEIMRLVSRNKDEPPFKARAVGATQALLKGAPVDDVTVHGDWSSLMIVDSFYRLSRSLASNFTQAVLP